jgi:hypothetical protein
MRKNNSSLQDVDSCGEDKTAFERGVGTRRWLRDVDNVTMSSLQEPSAHRGASGNNKNLQEAAIQ